MNYYRCACQESGGGSGNFAATYTATVNGVIQKGSCGYKYAENSTFNSNVVIGNNVNRCTNMFANCYNFNQNVSIPSVIEYTDHMFWHCHNYNQNFVLPSNLINAEGMFEECRNLNAECLRSLYLPKNIVDITTMFADMTYLNRMVYIDVPKSCMFANYLLMRTYNAYGGVNFYGTSYRNLGVSGLLYGHRNTGRMTIRFNSVLNNIFNVTNYKSIVGESISWTGTTNGFYNTYYNIYCYYNFPYDSY